MSKSNISYMSRTLCILLMRLLGGILIKSESIKQTVRHLWNYTFSSRRNRIIGTKRMLLSSRVLQANCPMISNKNEVFINIYINIIGRFNSVPLLISRDYMKLHKIVADTVFHACAFIRALLFRLMLGVAYDDKGGGQENVDGQEL